MGAARAWPAQIGGRRCAGWGDLKAALILVLFPGGEAGDDHGDETAEQQPNQATTDVEDSIRKQQPIHS